MLPQVIIVFCSLFVLSFVAHSFPGLLLDIDELFQVLKDHAKGKYGEYFKFWRWSQFATTLSFSCSVSWNMKCLGKRLIFRLTCSLSRLVVTPYNTAKSLLIMTFSPLSSRILFMIISSGIIISDSIFVILPAD